MSDGKIANWGDGPLREVVAYIDWLRTSLCRVCKAGMCSAHQPAEGYLDALVRQGLLIEPSAATPNERERAEVLKVVEAARRLVMHWSHPRPRVASVGYDEAEQRGKALLTSAVRNLAEIEKAARG